MGTHFRRQKVSKLLCHGGGLVSWAEPLDRPLKRRHISPVLGLKCATRKALGFPSEGPDLLRYTMYRRLLPLMAALAKETPGSGRALCISGGGHLVRPFAERGWEIVDTQFPRVDWERLPFDDQSFDLVLSDQVLEHVGDPFRCATEARRVIRPGGLQVHTTCLLNPIHGSPGDNWRFTPNGLRLLFSRESEIAVGGWGNPLAPFIWFLPAVLFRPTPTNPRHPYNWLATWSVERWPITTWYVGRAAGSFPLPDRARPDT